MSCTERNNNKTLAVITKILAKHAINSPGILITNAALPDNDPIGRELISKLVATYLYPKDFLNYHDKDYLAESPAVHGIDFSKWLSQVKKNLEFYYGQYITRLIIDHVSLISPYDRFPEKSVSFNRFFDITDKNELKQKISQFFKFDNQIEETDESIYEYTDFDESYKNVSFNNSLDFEFLEKIEKYESSIISENNIGEEYDGCDEFSYPILWSFSLLDKKINNGDNEYSKLLFDNNGEFEKFSELFLRQLNIQSNSTMLIENISQLTYLLREGSCKYLSETLQKIKKEHHTYKYYQFCDLVLFHQILDLF